MASLGRVVRISTSVLRGVHGKGGDLGFGGAFGLQAVAVGLKPGAPWVAIGTFCNCRQRLRRGARIALGGDFNGEIPANSGGFDIDLSDPGVGAGIVVLMEG